MKEEACSLNLAPTASTAAAMAMGDALAIALLERRGFKEEDFAALHPGGRLGKKLRRVEALMHAGEKTAARPAVGENAGSDLRNEPQGPGPRRRHRAEGGLLGIITDGDLRRMMQKRNENVLDLTAGDCMTKNPVTLARTELAASALRLMEEKKITSVLIVDAAGASKASCISTISGRCNCFKRFGSRNSRHGHTRNKISRANVLRRAKPSAFY